MKPFEIKFFLPFVFLCFAILQAMSAINSYGQKDSAAAEPKNPFLGRWKSDEAVIEFRSDSDITINGEAYKYRVKGSVITVYDDDGAIPFPFELVGDKLTVEFEGREIVYTRVKGKGGGTPTAEAAPAEGIIADFVGKWCYMSSLTGSNSYMSSRCFTLNANGTYEFSAESSSGGAYGSTAGQSYDTGRWTATRSTLTAHSNKHGKIVYPIVLRNHPKNGDPMIVVDGDAYVTVYTKRPW